MFKIEVVIQPFKLDDVKVALEGLGIGGTMFHHVFVHGDMAEQKAFYRGSEYEADVPRVKLELLVSSLDADHVIDVLSRVARTDKSGDDSTITVCEVADAISVRNRQPVQVAS